MASQLPLAVLTFRDQNGRPLIGGKVYFYAPGTETPKNTYKDSAGTVANTNPVILDGNGQGIFWGSGFYRQVVYDANGVLIWDQITREMGIPTSSAGLADAIGDETGTGVVVFSNSPRIVTPNLIGVGDGSIAPAGSIGEVLEAQAVNIGAPITTIFNVVALQLSPGDWDLQGVVNFVPSNTSMVTTFINASLSTISGAVQSYQFSTQVAANQAVNSMSYPTPVRRISTSIALTVYLVAQVSFSNGNMIANGYIRARRMR